MGVETAVSASSRTDCHKRYQRPQKSIAFQLYSCQSDVDLYMPSALFGFRAHHYDSTTGGRAAKKAAEVAARERAAPRSSKNENDGMKV